MEDVGDLTLVRVTARRIVDPPLIQAFGEELLQLLAHGRRRRLLLDFADVDYLASAALTKLIALHKRLRQEQGRLVLSGLAESIAEVFTITKLDRLFTICATEQDGIQRLQGP